MLLMLMMGVFGELWDIWTVGRQNGEAGSHITWKNTRQCLFVCERLITLKRYGKYSNTEIWLLWISDYGFGCPYSSVRVSEHAHTQSWSNHHDCVTVCESTLALSLGHVTMLPLLSKGDTRDRKVWSKQHGKGEDFLQLFAWHLSLYL